MSLITLEYVDALDANNEKKVLEFSTNLLKEPINKGSLFVIKVDGESMEPVIKDRTLVVADLSQRGVVDADIYLVYYENRMWIKKAKQESDGMTFVSINKEYGHLVYKEADVRVVAKAVLSFNSF
ncbi:protein containing peptidase S24-domain [Sulfurimonas gotlandica GD1]|uniref:Protein containing peptidase S24-domain n=1 Tax=Sulfurimonas gotlandica (strain DSM 19862 / JCM 16533 / GD1) TaxID=929558 RepID=B6BNE8_SULGG|nr:S24 family peptidase [Sulfurimonas gotlandica]EDZ61386.1 putative repressor [Sulfurimonas gotlandica GD1]EHP31018.1 protein containing peptidase S24-domain [Sulfurimonas gotlandica GD1]